MTVKELIEQLSQYPPDAVVLTDFCSDVDEVQPEHISFHPKDFHQGGKPENGYRFVKRNGRYESYNRAYWSTLQEPPDFVDAVHFRGN